MAAGPPGESGRIQYEKAHRALGARSFIVPDGRGARADRRHRDVEPRLGPYKVFHAIWSTANIEEGSAPPASPAGAEGIGQARLSRITPLSRQALLLTSLEGFSSEDAAYLIGAS